MKKEEVLLIISNSPYNNTSSQDGFDFAMAAAAFDMPLKIFLKDDGVLNLIKDQNSELLNRDNFIDFIKALELYELDPIYINQNILDKYNINLNNLIVNKNLIEIIDDNKFIIFIEQFNHILQY